jgi:hypothetical protein
MLLAMAALYGQAMKADVPLISDGAPLARA